MPAARHHTNLAAVGGKLVVAGSNDGLFFTARGETWIYDPQTDAWTEGASMPSGTERGAAAVGVIGEQMFIAGGLRGGDAVGDVSAYDPSADAWEALPALPEALDHLVGGVIDGVFYVVGGRKGGTGSHLPRVDAYDPAGGIWTPRSPMPTSRGGAAAGVVNGLLIVVGGEGNPDADSGVFDDAEAYDPVTDTWTTLPAMTTPRHGTGAAGLDGVLYVPGGADQELFGAVAAHEALVL
jgi:N-acetylneuraminic acid mutarotase